MMLSHIAILMSVILGALAALHAYWAAGGLWPAKTERELIDTVIGQPQLARMPPAWLTAVVATVLAVLAILPLLIVPVIEPVFFAVHVHFEAMKAAFVAALVFLGRGIAGYLPVWRRRHPAKPFATYDRLFYSPLCILLGLGLARK